MYQNNRTIVRQALIQKIRTKEELNALKRKTLKKTKSDFPSDLNLLKTYRNLLATGQIKKNERLEKLLTTRPIRTLSGIAAITVLTKPWPCPGKCIYCPNEKEMPKSYLKNEPAAQRAYLTNFDPERQVKVRLDSLTLTGHNTEKIELIILGGSFPAYPKKYQENFIQRCFDALNKRPSPNLALAQKRNEKAYHRCVGLSIETRPDEVNPVRKDGALDSYRNLEISNGVNLANIKWWRKLGVTRVEIGVQTLFDDLLKLSRRGHTVAEVARATQLLKDWGFKVVYHIMPNLPGATPKKDLEVFKILFGRARFQPDQIKIYPLIVLKSAPLYKTWQKGKYKPYSPKTLRNLLVAIKKIIPPYVRIIRLIRDIPAQSIIAGNKITNLRQILHTEKVECHCIRCREAKDAPLGKIYYFEQKYPASQGTEYYLSYENKNQTTLYAHLRLRFPSQKSQFANSALIREVHTYGRVASLKNQNRTIQHRGLGKNLIKKAEGLAAQNGYQKITVISGIGVREYYRKLGYRLGRFGYMRKNLKRKTKSEK